MRSADQSRESGVPMTSSSSAASAASRVIGPTCARVPKALAGYSGTRPYVGFSAKIPQKAAGIRTLPPPSVPSASGPAPSATAAAAPPLEPPAVRVGSCGLRVTPDSGESVTPFQPNSGVVVLPMNTAPCSRSRATDGASSSQRPCSDNGPGALQGGRPAQQQDVLHRDRHPVHQHRPAPRAATVRPTPGPAPGPRRAVSRTNAFTSGWIRSARSRAARVASTGLNSPLR